MMIPEKLGKFKRYHSDKTTMEYGYYYDLEVTLPFSKENKRMVRVWLPSNYDFSNPENRFPVIYMSDGQNLVDRYLSAYGDWELDKTVEKLIKEGHQGIIAVGLDCPKGWLERTKELCPPYPPKKGIYKREGGYFEPYANEYIDYIADTLKPLIDKTFFTDKNNTAIGGSSMGGIMAFYAYLYRPDIFNFSLSFSPAFFFYDKKNWLNILDTFKIDKENDRKLFMYCGGKDFESIFLKPVIYTYEYFIDKEFSNDQIALIIDTNEVHHEKAWAKYLYDGLKYWLS